jgi:PKD repeat protein
MMIAKTTELGKKLLSGKLLMLLSAVLFCTTIFAQQPKADFNASVLSGCSPLKVEFY